MIIAQALKNKEGNDPSQDQVSPNSKGSEMNHDSFDGESIQRRPSSGERIPNNGKIFLIQFIQYLLLFNDKE